MKRIILFLLTNLAIVLVLSISKRLFMTHPPLEKRIQALQDNTSLR